MSRVARWGVQGILAADRDGVTVICARSLGKDYRPADPGLVLAGWRGGVPQLWPEHTARGGGRSLASPADRVRPGSGLAPDVRAAAE